MRVSTNGVQAKTPSSGEQIFVISALLLSAGAFQNLLVNSSADTLSGGLPGMQFLWGFLYLVTLIIYKRHCTRPFRNLFVILPLLTVLGFVFVSTLWSQDPGLTARRSVALALTLVFGLYFASRFDQKRQFRLLARMFAVCIVLSFFFELLGLNPHADASGWYGVFFIKVHLGRNMALSALVFFFWKRVEPEKRTLANLGLVGSIVLVLLSRDVTSLLVLVFLFVLSPYLQWSLRKSAAWAYAGIAFLLLSATVTVVYVATHLEDVTTLLGKDPLLTGRVPLWILSTVMALRRPWWGYGYNAFWLPDEPYVQKIWNVLRWTPPHAHNGLLELWLELGLVGTGLFILVLAYYVVKALGYLRHDSGPAPAWPLIFLLFLFLANLTESVFLVTNNLCFILYVAVAWSLRAKTSEALSSAQFALAERRYA